MTDAGEETVSAGAAGGDNPPSPVTIVMELRGRRIASVTVDGPPLISSFAGLASFSGSQDSRGAIMITESRPQPRQLRWRGSLAQETLRLRRGDSEIVLSPDPAQPGAYSGSWRTHDVLEGHIYLDGGGRMRCPAAPPGNGTSPS
ncbi:MAG TPA: hypothetical protein VGW40_09830 [Allosphingosinicella sp.]|nr:hypothetical protein [Allosphingosinicella sp.]